MAGLSAGIGMANRDFTCILCKRKFSRMSADVILTEDSICDECLEDLGKLDEEALRSHISQRLAEQGLHEQETVNRIIEAVPGLLARKRRLDELINRVEKRKRENET